MQINKNSTIAGVPANTIRKILRKADPTIDAAAAGKTLQWNVNRAANLIGELTKLGYFTETDGSYIISEQGRAVRDAKWVDLLPRTMAEELLRRVIDKANVVNTLPESPLYVSEMYAIGDFLGEAPEMRVLEIEVVLEAYSEEELAERRGGWQFKRYDASHLLWALDSVSKYVSILLPTDMSPSERKLIFSRD